MPAEKEEVKETQWHKNQGMKEISIETGEELTPDWGFYTLSNPALKRLGEAAWAELSQSLCSCERVERMTQLSFGSLWVNMTTEALRPTAGP